VLIPKLGGLGAGISTATTVIIENIIKLLVVQKKLNIYPIKYLRK
jgi:O-antigen/teichoic acid export membrane protein